MKVANVGPVSILTVGRETRLALTVTTADGEATDVQVVAPSVAALDMGRRLIIEALGRQGRG